MTSCYYNFFFYVLFCQRLNGARNITPIARSFFLKIIINRLFASRIVDPWFDLKNEFLSPQITNQKNVFFI